jgi:formylglycine-generating enzyme required for sulfatase activity
MSNDRNYKNFENTEFNRKYFLRNFKGSGAYGAVFLAQELAGRFKIRDVAIKAIRKDLSKSQDIVKELKIAINLEHPNLVNCITYEQGRLCNKNYPEKEQYDYPCFGLVMEIADGSLDEYLKTKDYPPQKKALNLQEAVEIVQAIASGLAYLHSQLITHRDLKPANILRVGNVWKIADFGIAREMRSETGTLTKTLAGSPAYMPPEAYEAKENKTLVKVSPAWDIWALGVIIVEILTGKLPFKDVRDIWQAQVTIPDNLPKPFDQIVKGCLHKDPKQRWTAWYVSYALNHDVSIPSIPILPTSTGHAAVPLTVETQLLCKVFSPSRPLILTLPNNQIIELVEIPAGSFMMGSDGNHWEKPIHKVTLKGFRMGKYPITQKQYKAVMGNNPSYFQEDENCPVERVSWNDAVSFCEKLSEMTGEAVRLPTEAEWEYACRAGSSGRYCFGDDPKQLENYAWYANNSGDKSLDAVHLRRTDKDNYIKNLMLNKCKTHPVGKKEPNEWGLYDMHGNVCEWCEDLWHESYESAPTDGSAWTEGIYQEIRSLRGGSWVNSDFYCRSANRAKCVADLRLKFIGFRVVV